jgi:hypothetical protein
MTDQFPTAGGLVGRERLMGGAGLVGGGVLARSDGIEISPVEDGYVVFDPGQDRVHHLNPTAALVLELCTGGNTAADIGAALRAVFQPGEPIEGQIGSCIDQLLSEGLIHHTGNGGPHCAPPTGQKRPDAGVK